MSKLFSKMTPYTNERIAKERENNPSAIQCCMNDMKYNIKSYEDVDPIGDDVYRKSKRCDTLIPR